MSDKMFFDTNILVYAYDASEPGKRKTCKKLIEKVYSGEIAGVVSNQILVEFFNALTRKFGVKQAEAKLMVRALATSDRWSKINYNCSTVEKVLNNHDFSVAPFLDALIAETMKENGVNTIVTENIKDFDKIIGIRVINPF
jgi:predicted nucleic acid-binding protein